MIFVKRRVLDFAVLIWSAVWLLLAQNGHSFSVSPMASKPTEPNLRLHAMLQEQETTIETVVGDDEQVTSSSLSALFPKNKQILKFVEPKTNVTVMLIGSMHYNPASINLVETTVEDLGKSDQLASVIIESCDIRWNKTQEMIDKKREQREQKLGNTLSESNENFIDSNPNDKDFLGNEMRAAWEVATLYNRPTVLGDQRINITMDALKSSLKETATDLFLGGPSGWKRSTDEIVTNWKSTVPISAGQPETKSGSEKETKYLNAFAFFDPRLLLSLPVSLVKYPLSFLLKDPVPVGLFFASIAFLNFYADGTTTANFLDPSSFSLDDFVATATSPREYEWTDYIFSIVVSVLETVVFARLLLKPLLADRNEILARSILDQCQLYASSNSNNNGGLGSFFQNFFSASSPLQQASLSEEAPVYVPGSDPESFDIKNNKSNNEGKIVVAVLGMAHCNGIMKLLREQKV